MRELAVLAKYPFLNDTKEYIKSNGLSVEELLEHPLYERARSIGIERLDNALKNTDVGDFCVVTESDCMMVVLSYPIARMVAVCVGDTYFKKRYALGEAYCAYRNLLDEPTSFLLDATKELGLHAESVEENQQIRLYFKDYLRFAPTHYKEWNMTNRTIDHGFVTISQKDLARILLEVLRKRINDELDARECDPLATRLFSEDIKRFQNIVNMQKKKIEAAPVGKLSVEKLPPCMKDILAAIQAGENVPHMGRFALVAFLHSLKLSPNEILKLFSTAPDYEEDKTRYQVEHISGKTSSTEYKSPGCDKMRTYGICPQEKIDELCRRVHHPASYYSAKWRQEKQKT